MDMVMKVLRLRIKLKNALSVVVERRVGKQKLIELLEGFSHSEHYVKAAQRPQHWTVWFGCVCLLHCLLDADHLKQQLLRVQLTTSPSETPSSLLHHLSTILISLGNHRPQTRAGLLMLLSAWLHNCPLAVAQFISIEENVQYLTTHIDGYGNEGSEAENQIVRGLIAFLLTICLVFDETGVDQSRKNALSVVVERRVGKQKLIELLEGFSHSEHYVKAAQRPQPLAKSAQDLLLDYHFTKFFKSVEGSASTLKS
ncbi:hypothetical protein WUBG_14907 [Wuchereria bancrofti]|uniref:Vesicle tethering protein Uso1/P115-like head domain-containing protein n=1 Tax=Wuchereria bancrofti TaxID=6293 RepID=J9AJ35_WUCBA|nr:hypothetical protein WUBG_14907 [Wuchereria bancrofti]